MARTPELEAVAYHEFTKAIACIYAHGDRLEDGTEVVWDENYASAQLWNIIYNARLLSGDCPENTSAFYTPNRRANSHAECVDTYLHKIFRDGK